MKQTHFRLTGAIGVILCFLSAWCQTAHAGIEIAEELLVDLRSEDLAAGPVTEWPNHGSLGGSFVAVGTPVVENVGDWENAVSLDGQSYFEGPRSVPGIEGSDPRSVEIWAYKIGLAGEETMLSWAHRGGPDGTNFGFNYSTNSSWGAVGHWGGGPDMGWGGNHAPTPAVETWWHLVYTYDGTTARLYVNGEPAGEEAMTLNTHANGIIRVGAQGDNTGEQADTNMNYSGAIAQVRIHDGVLTPEQIQINAQIRVRRFETASNPSPAQQAVDVPSDASLSWLPGETAKTHTVYLSDEQALVAAGDPAALIAEALDVPAVDTGPLGYGQIYYWRVDEVNGAPDHTVFPGEVWSFTVEPYSIPVAHVTATASSTQSADMGPENTVNGSGLDALDQHSTEGTEMWLSAMGDPPVWIQYEFDRAYKLDKMLVWNSNQLIEAFVGLGVKDATIEVSTDGTDWTAIENVAPFLQAPGTASYAANTVVDFSGALAKYVKISVASGYGPLGQYGLSEVRFFYVPTIAREPEPEDGTMSAGVDVELNWRAGREAAAHQVYLGTDAGNLSLIDTSVENSLLVPQLDYAQTYFWQIVEVNETQIPASYAGPVWQFETPAYAVIDDFEGYDDLCTRIFFAWEDGLGHNGGADIADCDVPASNGNGGGSIVGNASAPFAERVLVHAGRQSMPFAYDNNFGPSEATLEFASQNWQASGIKSLSLFLHGAGANTGQLYVKINDTKLSYDGAAADIAGSVWRPWIIDLATVGGNLQSVTSLTIGVDGAGATGILYIDDIRLYPRVAEYITPAVPDPDAIIAHYTFDEGTGDVVADASGKGLDGVVQGVPQWVPGILGGALQFNGSSHYVDCGHDADHSVTDSLTIAVWINANSFGDWRGIVTKGVDNGAYAMQMWGDGALRFAANWGTVPGGVGQGQWNTTSLMTTGEWGHAAITYGAGSIRFYLDGIPSDTVDVDLQFGQLDESLILGCDFPGGDEYFDGIMDDVRIYNQALSAGEVMHLAGKTQPIPKPF